jgi:hypothetical protein
MFYTEEEIQPVVTLATKIFGRVGNMCPSPYMFISVQTNKFGAVWYGDIQGTADDVISLTKKFAAEVKDRVTVTDLARDVTIVTI